MMKFRNQRGFTLLEIMLVVLIIGIIALLALPRLLVTRKMAQLHTCVGNQQAIQTHLESYKWVYGFYPLEDEWVNFTNDTNFWPSGRPAPLYCPAGTDYPYEYLSDVGLGSGESVSNEHGDGWSQYSLSCTNLVADPPHEPLAGI